MLHQELDDSLVALPCCILRHTARTTHRLGLRVPRLRLECDRMRQALRKWLGSPGSRARVCRGRPVEKMIKSTEAFKNAGAGLAGPS